MMGKKRFLIIILMAMFLFIGRVAAEEEIKGTCSTTDKTKLMQEAANVKITYLPVSVTKKVTDGESGYTADLDAKYLEVRIYNLSYNYHIDVKYGGNGLDSKGFIVTYPMINSEDGAYVFRQNGTDANVSYTFTIIADNGGCVGEVLRSVRLTLPKYNYYAELETCKDIPDYYLCQDFTTYNIDGLTFYDKVDQYKEKLAAAENNAKKDNNGTVSKTLTAVSKHKYLVVGVIVAVGAVATVIVLRKKRSVL
jgi:hypothetical protein